MNLNLINKLKSIIDLIFFNILVSNVHKRFRYLFLFISRVFPLFSDKGSHFLSYDKALHDKSSTLSGYFFVILHNYEIVFFLCFLFYWFPSLLFWFPCVGYYVDHFLVLLIDWLVFYCEVAILEPRNGGYLVLMSFLFLFCKLIL